MDRWIFGKPISYYIGRFISIYKMVVFPKKTHFSKLRETTYQEFIKNFEVTTVLKPSGVKLSKINV